MRRPRRWGGILSLPPKSQPDVTYILRRENILVLDIFFEALNYETIEQKKAYEVAGLLGECWRLCRGPCGSTQPASSNKVVSRLPRAPWPCSRGTGMCRQHGCRAEHLAAMARHSSDEFCPFSAPSATGRQTRSTLMTSLSSAGDIGGQMGLFIGASILTVLELFDYAYEVSVSAVPRLPGGPGYPGAPKRSCGTRGKATHEPPRY